MQINVVMQQAKDQLQEITGLTPVTVSGAFKDGDGWHVRLDMLELSRIPTATDVLGDYEVLLSEDGSLIRFERKRTRIRGAPVEEAPEA